MNDNKPKTNQEQRAYFRYDSTGNLMYTGEGIVSRTHATYESSFSKTLWIFRLINVSVCDYNETLGPFKAKFTLSFLPVIIPGTVSITHWQIV